MEKDQPHLRLLPSTGPESASLQPSIQGTLFPMMPSAQTVAFVQMGTSSKSLIELLEWIRPRCVVDLRPLPRFDFGTLNRRKAFEHFHRIAAAYHDLFGTLGFHTRSDAHMQIDIVADALARLVGQLGTKVGPVVVLVDEPPSREETTCFPRRLSEVGSGIWDVLVA